MNDGDAQLRAGIRTQFDAIDALACTRFPIELVTVVSAAIDGNLGCERHNIGLAASDGSDPRAAVACRFAEQFVVDVAGVGNETRAELGATFGAETFAFVQVVYVLDAFQRARIAFEEFAIAWETTALLETHNDLWTEIETWMRAVACRGALDAVTTELVRLRGARAHQCRVCLSRLNLDAVDAAGEDTMFATTGAVQLANPKHAVAVELTDVLVTQPRVLDAALVARVREQFSEDEIEEMIFDVVRNAANKIAVAFGADAPAVAEGVEYFRIDDHGGLVASADATSLRSS